LLELVEEISTEMGIEFDFINLGGGFGIPYHPDEKPLNIGAFAKGIAILLTNFGDRQGYVPALFMESGRFVTGPHGVLVTRVTNVKHTYRTFVGVDAAMPALMRPGMYDAYHHISVHGKQTDQDTCPQDVVGSLCENNDKFAVQRPLPALTEGDILLIHDTGAHGHSMGFNYNGRLRPKELLLCQDGSVKLIRRAETIDDYLTTLSFPFDSIF
jgi:diaminopimelate decarboxylase